MAKEIYVRFHATFWPAMLMGLGLPLPANVVGHGWWTVGGEKGAKSKGNIPLPQEVTAWLQAEAIKTFTDRVDYFRRCLALPAPATQLSRARTRWGSCSIGGRIRLNWRLIQMPLALIDYVVAHEVEGGPEMSIFGNETRAAAQHHRR